MLSPSITLKSGIARRLILYILCFSSIVTLVMTSLQLYLDYARDVRLIEERLHQIETSYLPSIRTALWVSNQKLLEVQIEGIMQLPDIQHVSISSDKEHTLSSGITPKKSVIERNFSLNYKYRNKNVFLGKLHVVASLDAVYQRLLDKAFVILTTQAIKTFLVSMFIFFLFYFLVGRHLIRMAKYSEKIDLDHLDNQLTLNRSVSKGKKSDELETLVLSINKMRSKLQKDIAERLIVEDRLRVNQKLLNKSQQISHLGSWHLDIKKNVLAWSDEEYRIFGRTPQEFGATYEAFLDTIHADDRDMVDRTYTKAIENNHLYECVHRIIRPNGEERIVFEKSEDVVDENGITIHSFGFTQDITEQKQAEEKLRKSEESLAMGQKVSCTGSWDWDIAADKLTWSNETYRQFGLKPQEIESSYKLFEGFVHPDYLSIINRGVERALNEDKPYSVDARMIRSDGAEWFMHAQGVVYRNKEGKAIRFIGTQQDITDLKKVEQEKEDLAFRLQQAQKMEAIGTLAGGIAHDFNNILGAILGYADMAKEDAPPGTRFERDLEKVLIGANRAKDLVKQILAFSRQVQVDRIPIMVQALIKEGLKMLRSSIPTTISITEDIDPKSGIILADPTQVHQILMNLCTNAYQAMEETGGELFVSLKNTINGPDRREILDINPGEYVELSVSDTGSGIGPDTIGKIFEPYFTTKEIGKGTGMGLAIIHGIMKEYGGTITVESKLGAGTTFHVYFPVVEKEALPEVEEPENIPRGKERVLFIDDEELLAEMGKDMLERLGYHVTVRRSSIEALTTFQNTPDEFDIVITDQTMPEMTGSDLARRMMQIRPDIPIILCTGYSNLIDEQSAKGMGIKEFSLKPLTKDKIAKLIRKVLDAS